MPDPLTIVHDERGGRAAGSGNRRLVRSPKSACITSSQAPAGRVNTAPTLTKPTARAPRPTLTKPTADPEAGQGGGHGARQAHVVQGRRQLRLDTESSAAALLTLRQAGDYLRVSYWTVRAWGEDGRLKVVRLPGDGRLIRVERAELDRLIEACRAT